MINKVRGTRIIISFSFVAILFFSSCVNKKLERRVNALERRVQALEGQNGHKPVSENVKLASTPEKVQPGSNLSEFEFESTEFNFGTINEGDIINHTFTFTNTGNTPLIIEKATATCGCTVPKWPKRPIPVGGTGEIDIRFDSKNKPNRQIKTITITANTEPALTRLKIMGFVTPKSDLAGPVKTN